MSKYEDYEDYDEYVATHEPRTLPDFWIEPDAKCGVCGVQNSIQRPMRWVCSECGGPTHTECGHDCEPSGGWDRDYEVNYWVCNKCLEKNNQAYIEQDQTQGVNGEEHPFDVSPMAQGLPFK